MQGKIRRERQVKRSRGSWINDGFEFEVAFAFLKHHPDFDNESNKDTEYGALNKVVRVVVACPSSALHSLIVTSSKYALQPNAFVFLVPSPDITQQALLKYFSDDNSPTLLPPCNQLRNLHRLEGMRTSFPTLVHYARLGARNCDRNFLAGGVHSSVWAGVCDLAIVGVCDLAIATFDEIPLSWHDDRCLMEESAVNDGASVMESDVDYAR